MRIEYVRFIRPNEAIFTVRCNLFSHTAGRTMYTIPE